MDDAPGSSRGRFHIRRDLILGVAEGYSRYVGEPVGNGRVRGAGHDEIGFRLCLEGDEAPELAVGDVARSRDASRQFLDGPRVDT